MPKKLQFMNVMNCGEVTPRRRHSGDESRIPVPNSPILRRSGSQRLNSFSPIEEHSRNGSIVSRPPLLNRHRSLSLNAPLSSCVSPDLDDDLDSVQSFGSNASVTSTMSQCDHASFARNGTTFSSRQKRFVVHCSPQMGNGEEYLTPTQRASRTIRRLKNLLSDAQAEVIEKDQEIFRLTKEVVELRLLKAGGNFSEKDERNENASYCLTIKNSLQKEQNSTSQNEVTSTSGLQLSPSPSPSLSSSVVTCGAKDVRDHIVMPCNGGGVSPTLTPLGDVPPSLVDSGHFEDLNTTKDWGTNSSHNSPSILQPQLSTLQTLRSQPPASPQPHSSEENIRRQHEDEIRKLREKHNDKVDSLLQRITEANDRYYELRPKYEAAENKIREMELENENLKKHQAEAEETYKDMYLKMFKKGQEAAKYEKEVDQTNNETEQMMPVSKHEDVLRQLNITKKELENVTGMYRRLLEQRKPSSQHDPEMTLQFLKSAIYYFLTDRENMQGHQAAIESILGFTDSEKLNIEKSSYFWR